MAKLVGAPEADLEWSLSWTSDDPADAASLGVLIVSIRGEQVWAPEDGDWPWIDLLRWLSKSWAWLKAEEGPPAPLDPDAASLRDLESTTRTSSLHATNATVSRASMALWDFRETHDLSRALAGASAPPIVIWREGLTAQVLTEDERFSTRWRDAERFLGDIGDAIATRLKARVPKDATARQVTRAWQDRERKTSGRWLSIARGQAQPNVVPLPAKWDDVPLGEIETSPLVAAARMTSNLTAPLADKILQLLHDMPRVDSTIDKIAVQVGRSVDLATTNLAFEQAYALATAFRAHLRLHGDEPFEPVTWLEQVGVWVSEVRLGNKNVEAVAAWGPANGPGILINLDGTASSSRSGRNASLVHEICHLIIDRETALPAAEVMGGRVDARVEQRARAFAAEVLLPRSAAGRRFADVGDETGAQQAVNSLTRRFVVSREVVAWQARNSEVALSPEVFEYLRGLVRFPDRF